jgi:hypothetical protein
VRLRNALRRGLARPGEGARTSIHVASAPELARVTGRYFRGCREVASSPASYDAELARAVWAASERLVGPPPLAGPTDVAPATR